MRSRQTERVAWLESLQVGDTITVPTGRYYPPRPEQFKLVRRTPTQHVIAPVENQQAEYRIRRKDGMTLGLGEYSHFPLYLSDVPEKVKLEWSNEHERLQLARQLREVKWQRLSGETLKRVMEIVKEEKRDENTDRNNHQP